jgi:hypothetical protein
MNIIRLVGLAAAAVITATQWAALSSPRLYTQSVQAIAAPVADDVPEGALPVIVVRAHFLP